VRGQTARALGVSAAAHGHAAILAVACLLALPGCSSSADGTVALSIEPVFAPDPPVVGPLAVELALADSAGVPITGASVRVEGNMSHPGMVPSHGVVTQIGPARFRAELELTMPGDWILLVEVELPDGRCVERVLSLQGVRVP
jgi:hypothetical protein